jgi:competence ComEA-like helix-hairpin-helix protein
MNALWKVAIALALAFCLAGPSFSVAQPKKPLPTKPLDLNTATFQQLQQLPTVGPVAANAIVTFRIKSGPFRKVEDLLAVKGFTKKRLAKIRPYITVIPPPAKPPAKPPPKKQL